MALIAGRRLERLDAALARFAAHVARRPIRALVAGLSLFGAVASGMGRLELAPSVEDLLLRSDPVRVAFDRGPREVDGDEAVLVPVGGDLHAKDLVDRFEAPRDDFGIEIPRRPAATRAVAHALARDIRLFTTASLVVMAAILFAFFGRASAVMLALGVTAPTIVATLGAMGWLGLPISPFTQILPSLLVAIGFAQTVHLASPFFEAVDRGDARVEAISHAYLHSGTPVLLATLTTAIGFGAFGTAPLARVADLGFASMAGLACSLLGCVILVPAVMALVPVRPRARTPRLRSALDRGVSALGCGATRHPRRVIVAWSVGLAFAGIAASGLEIRSDPLRWLPESREFVRAAESADPTLAGVFPLTIAADGRGDGGLLDPNVMRGLDGFEARARTLADEERPGVDVTITDVPMSNARSEALTVVAMVRAYALTLLSIAPILLLLVGRLRLWAVAGVPNLAPIVMGLALMRIVGLDLDSFSMLIASLAIGIAVDDTIHLLYRWRRAREAGDSSEEAVRRTLCTTGGALLTTSVVLAAGFLVFVGAETENVVAFGWLTGFVVAVAFLADVQLCPALLSIAEGREPALPREAVSDLDISSEVTISVTDGSFGNVRMRDREEKVGMGSSSVSRAPTVSRKKRFGPLLFGLLVGFVGSTSLSIPDDAHALCDVIPQGRDVFRGAAGAVDRPFAGPGDRLEISVDPAGCEAGASFEGPYVRAQSDFDAVSGSWSPLGATSIQTVGSGGNPGAFLRVDEVGGDARVSAAGGVNAYLGDWLAAGLTTLSFDLQIVDDGGGILDFVEIPLVRVGGPGFAAEYRIVPSSVLAGVSQGQWVHFDLPLGSTLPAGWTSVSGSWASGADDVDELTFRVDVIRNGSNKRYGLDNITLAGTGADGVVVSFVLESDGGPAHAFVVSPVAGACAGPLSGPLTACTAALGGGTVTCVEDPTQVVTTPTSISLPFPQTAPFQGDPSGLAGPTSIAVTALGAPLPCGLATTRCADPGAPAGMHACVDEIYADDGTCSTLSSSRSRLHPGFTGLPERNYYRDLCQANPDVPACTGIPVDVRAALDADGNIVVPMDYEDVELPDALPIPRLVSFDTTLEAFSGGVNPISLPSPAFYDSFSTRGQLLPPFFRQTADPTSFLGSVDARRGVTRFLRRSPAFRECRDDGTGDPVVPGRPCADPGDCPAGSTCGEAVCYAGNVATSTPCLRDAQCGAGQECGPALFSLDFLRSTGGAGPIVVPAAKFVARALNPVPLDCLLEGDGFLLACRSESSDGVDLNGDADVADETVVTLRSLEDGLEIPIDGQTGVAASRVRDGVFTRPAAVVEASAFAFLASEVDEANTSQNLDGDAEDSILRVFRVETGGILTDLVAGLAIAADESPVIDERPLALSDGLVFYRESELDTTLPAAPEILSTDAGGTPGTAFVQDMDVTPDGRFVVFSTRSSLVLPDVDNDVDIFLRDRDTDEDGIYDEMGASSITRVTLGPGGVEADGNSNRPRISDDGRWVVYATFASNLTSTPTFDEQLIVWDRLSGVNEILATSGSIVEPEISGDGRFVVFAADATAVAPDPNPSFRDVLLFDRDADEDGVFDDEGNGVFDPGEIVASVVSNPIGACAVGPDCADNGSGQPRISGNGRWILFSTSATNLLGPGTDTNGVTDAYLAEVSGSTATVVGRVSGYPETSISVAEELNGGSRPAVISRDGRFAVVTTFASNVPAELPNGATLVIDLDPDENGIFEFSTPDGIPRFDLRRLDVVEGNDEARTSISDDGRFVLEATDTGAGAVFRLHDLVTRSANELALSAPIINPNKVNGGGLGDRATFRAVNNAVGNGQLELQGIQTGPLPPGDLNGDGDVLDQILGVLDTQAMSPVPVLLGPASRVALADGNAVFLDEQGEIWLWRNRQVGPPIPLALSARRLALSTDWIAALVAEEDEGLDLNADGDQVDWVLHVNALATATAGTWVNTQMAADLLAIDGAMVALRSTAPASFEELLLYDAAGAASVDPAASNPGAELDVRDLLFRNGIVAYRSSEALAATILNADDDTDEDVLQVFDVATGAVFNARQAAIPCPFAACEQAEPYRIEGETVRFITREIDQEGSVSNGEGCIAPGGACDLDGDGAGGGFVLQRFDVAKMRMTLDAATSRIALPRAAGGICTDTGAACNRDDDCPSGTCFVPPGGCVNDTGFSCSQPSDCAGGEYCDLTSGTCFVREGPCEEQSDCTPFPGAVCVAEGQDFQRIANPVSGGGDGVVSYTSSGLCVDGSGNPDGTCRTSTDCAVGFSCVADLIDASSADADGDGVPDIADNCGDRPNPSQADLDGDGIGDACDLETCGDGIQSYDEACDGGGDCNPDCTQIGGLPACANGEDDDGDGLVDAGQDPGCSDASDSSEREATLACDNGVDDDGDGMIDANGDVGCAGPGSPVEDPECQDGIGNDDDGLIDFDGGLSVRGVALTAPDPDCLAASDPIEVPEPGVVSMLVTGSLALSIAARRRARSRLAARGPS